MELADALSILRANHHCVLASASPSGQPWVSPVFFNYDESLKLVFESAGDARHARLIAENPRIAVVVASLEHKADPAGVYLECAAREVPARDLETALEVFLEGPHRKELERTPADYLDGKPLRLYEALPYRLFGLTQVTRDGYVIDQRVELPLPGGAANGRP